MPTTARATWLDAWEGPSTPSPYSYRGAPQHERHERYERERADAYARPARYEAPRRYEAPSVRPQVAVRDSRYYEWNDASEWTGSVVRMSAAREARRATAEPSQERWTVPDAPAIRNYDWEAAAQRRPGRDECERVILHTDRSIEARMSSTRYYGREATARHADPWPEAPRRKAAPRLRVVKHRVPRWRLGLVAGVFAVLLIGLTVVAPILTSSTVAGMESAVGQAEAQQQQLAADTAALSSEISSLSSPQRVAEQAAQMGLVPANDVSYLSSGEQQMASEGDTTVAGR
jgi:cell division protein FtsB